MHDHTFPVSASQRTEDGRKAALARYDLDDASYDESFGRITQQAAQEMDAPVAFIGLIDETCVRLKWRHGMSAEAVDRNRGCNTLDRLATGVFAVVDNSDQPRVVRTLFETEEAACMRSFAAAPLRTFDGHVVGALCVMDRRPRLFNDRDRNHLASLATAAMSRAEMRRSLRQLRSLEGQETPEA